MSGGVLRGGLGMGLGLELGCRDLGLRGEVESDLWMSPHLFMCGWGGWGKGWLALGKRVVGVLRGWCVIRGGRDECECGRRCGWLRLMPKVGTYLEKGGDLGILLITRHSSCDSSSRFSFPYSKCRLCQYLGIPLSSEQGS